MPRICKNDEVTRTIYWNSKRSNNFLKQDTFLTCYWRFQSDLKHRTIKMRIGTNNWNVESRNLQEQVRKTLSLPGGPLSKIKSPTRSPLTFIAWARTPAGPLWISETEISGMYFWSSLTVRLMKAERTWYLKEELYYFSSAFQRKSLEKWTVNLFPRIVSCLE